MPAYVTIEVSRYATKHHPYFGTYATIIVKAMPCLIYIGTMAFATELPAIQVYLSSFMLMQLHITDRPTNLCTFLLYPFSENNGIYHLHELY